jgi:hypothetical protein
MKKHMLVAALSVILSSSGAWAASPPQQDDMLARPTTDETTTFAHYAWYLFTQAVRPTRNGLVFEGWTEQCQLNPNLAGCPAPSASAAQTRVLHASALATSIRNLSPATASSVEADTQCSPMNTKPLGGYEPPSNVLPTARYCEEVYVNPPEANFVKANGLNTLSEQQAYALAHSGAITFPRDAVEFKADWVPASSFSPTFQCPDTTHSLYTETINGTCYALVGIHIASKVLPNWLWATFEPASLVTNPNRCDPDLYGECFDPWGTTSKVPYGKGRKVPQSPQLAQLMTDSNLDPAFRNYYLTGVQSQFVDAQGTPVQLGNSFIEFNTGLSPGQSSCITCHKYAYFNGKQQSPENNFGGPPAGWPSVGYACNTAQKGNCTPVTPNSISQDYSWILGLMPVH